MTAEGLYARSEVVSSIKHPAVADARRSLGQVGGQEATSFLADGGRLVSQALDAPVAVRRIFFLEPVEGEEAGLLRRARDAGAPCTVVTRGVFFRVLALGYETSVRVLAVVERPTWAPVGGSMEGDACVLAGEGMQDPRNVGVLIRTVDAWGLPGAIFSEDSADPYSRASVRSSTGSAFRVPVTRAAHLTEYLAGLRRKSVRIIGTSAQAGTPCWDADLSGPCVVLLGNEGVGLSDEVRDVCDLLVSVPMFGGAHSLNVTVAAGIVLYERARRARSSAAP